MLLGWGNHTRRLIPGKAKEKQKKRKWDRRKFSFCFVGKHEAEMKLIKAHYRQ